MNALRIWADNFTPLRSRNIRIYLAGQGVSLVGTFLQQTALGLLVYHLSGGEAAPLGVLSFCTALPLLLFSPFTGGLADRFPRRWLMAGCALVQMGVAIALAVLSHTGAVQLGHIYALALVLGTAQSVNMPAQQAFCFDLAGLDQIRKLVSINSMVLNISRTGGPALAGYLVARFGVEVAFWQNGLSFSAVLLSLWAVRLAAVPRAVEAAKSDLFATLRQIAGSTPLRSLYACSAILHLFGLAMLQMTPALTHGDARETGLVLGAAGGGSLVYAVLLSPFFGRLRRVGLALCLSLVWMGGWLTVAALSASLTWRMAAMFLFGLATSMAMVGCTGTMQFIAPAASRGRLMGLFGMVGFGGQPFATLGVGLLADRFGPAPAVAATGIAAALLALLVLSQRGWASWTPDGSPVSAATPDRSAPRTPPDRAGCRTPGPIAARSGS